MKDKTQKRTIYSVIVLGLVVLLAISPLICGEKKSATDVLGFDVRSETGCTNDQTWKNTAPDGIKLQSGWGEFSFDGRYTTMDMRFYANFRYVGNELEIIFKDSDDAGNQIVITITAKTDKTEVDVQDRFSGETKEDNKQVSVRSDARWAKLDILIERTSDGLDGNRKVMTIEVDGEKAITDFILLSADLTTEVSERSLNEIRFESTSRANEVYVDDITITAENTNSITMGFSYTPVLLISGLVFIMILLVWRNMKTTKAQKSTGNKIGGKK